MHDEPTQNVCTRCDTVHLSIDCPVCYPGKFASAVDKLFGFHKPLPFVAALMAGMAITATAGAQIASSTGDPSPSGPEVTDVYVKPAFGGFQSRAIFLRTPQVGWPHRLNARELRSVALGVKTIHGRIYRERGLPRGAGAVCEVQRGTVQCVVRNRAGRMVAWYPVRRMWEDGSVSVWLPLAPSMSVSLGYGYPKALSLLAHPGWSARGLSAIARRDYAAIKAHRSRTRWEALKRHARALDRSEACHTLRVRADQAAAQQRHVRATVSHVRRAVGA